MDTHEKLDPNLFMILFWTKILTQAVFLMRLVLSDKLFEQFQRLQYPKQLIIPHLPKAFRLVVKPDESRSSEDRSGPVLQLGGLQRVCGCSKSLQSALQIIKRLKLLSLSLSLSLPCSLSLISKHHWTILIHPHDLFSEHNHRAHSVLLKPS